MFDKKSSIAMSKLKQLNSVLPLSQFSNILLACLCCFILIEKVDKVILISWLSTFIVISFLRLIILFIHKKAYSQTNSRLVLRHLNEHRYGIFASAIIWGFACLYIYPGGDLRVTFYFVFIIMGVTAGSLIIHSIDLPSALMYPICILFPLIFSLVRDSLQMNFPILFGTSLYLIFILVNTKKISSDRENVLAFNYDLYMSEKEKASSEERFKLLLNHSPIGIVHYDLDMKVSYCNEQFVKIMGIEINDLKTLNLDALKDQNAIKKAKECLKGKMTEYNGEYRMSLQQKRLWLHVLSSPVKDKQGAVIGGVSIIQDSTEQKNAEDKIMKLAFYDTLTQLPNRRMLIDELNKSLIVCKRNKNHGAIMFLDLDRFKSLNDTLGHDYGDLLLQKVAQRLRECVKQSDVVARFGGDEFVVLLNGLDTSFEKMKQDAKEVSQRILQVLNEPFELLGHHYNTSPSIGVVLFGEKNDSQEDLLKYADIAMYQAKKAGRNHIKFFDYTMEFEITKRVSMETKLQAAVKNEDFILFYQPQVDENGYIYSVEALVRWRDGNNLIFPNDFIEIAEETGLISGVGHQVIKTAFKQLSFWQDVPYMKGIEISINISASQFKERNFADKVLYLVEKYKVDTSLIKFEITESSLLESSDDVIQRMLTIRDCGIRFSLDDFGVEYSSLNYLKKLPIDELKIDKGFVRDIIVDTNDSDIVKTIIAVAKSFNFQIIAEGVEKKEQYKLLLELGCKNFQGYFFSRPIPPNELEVIVQKNNRIISI